MSKELATSIVLAARKMELNEKKEVISIIYHMPNGTYCINAPEFKSLYSFEILYNYLIQQGYRAASEDHKFLLNKLEDSEAKRRRLFSVPMAVFVKTLENE